MIFQSFLHIANISILLKAAALKAKIALPLTVPIPSTVDDVSDAELVVVGNDVIDGGQIEANNILECLSRPFMLTT